MKHKQMTAMRFQYLSEVFKSKNPLDLLNPTVPSDDPLEIAEELFHELKRTYNRCQELELLVEKMRHEWSEHQKQDIKRGVR